MRSRAWIEIDPEALTHNATVLRRAVPAGTQLGILVKANGYGHGMVVAAQAAIAGGAEQLMVASLDEALDLRIAGLTCPILVVYPIDPVGLDEAALAGIDVSISGGDGGRRLIERWMASRRRADTALRLQVEIDSGMGRGGVQPGDVPGVVAMIAGAEATEVVGIWSHLADGRDPTRTATQVRVFDEAFGSVSAATPRRPDGAMPIRHIAATEGLFCRTAPAYELVRIGLGFYGELGPGVEPAPAVASLAADLRPAMTVAALPVRLEWLPIGATVGYGGEWTAERRSLIATLPIGYADGYARSAWPGASALVRGRRVPLVGRVSMDSVCVDATDAADLGELTMDEPFVVLGRQGGERITAGDLADLRSSIPNEVFCAFGPRLDRRIAAGATATRATAADATATATATARLRDTDGPGA